MSDPRIVVALDYPDAAAALAFAARVSPGLCRLKVGKELFTVAGPQLVEALVARGFDVFLDLKFHDIPNTVAQACKMAAGLGVWMVNVHASGGRKMMETTRDALEALPQRPLLIAVTVLTSMDAAQLAEIGLPEPAVQVERLARLTKDCGLDGVVCSAQEAGLLKAACGRDFKLVTPGIRPADAALDDQSRVMTPQAAVAAGSDYLVIGRPITQSADPLATLQSINLSLGAA
ncbi:Orotidine 5'-phosphate decarboxylase [Andreprevotia sp. IGB-42]|uniref:orotidine-5'-phosphate decarboxylase n=1 Tax=Andreprevotia sp. IGB-42 TaxID=2497473 RepID=UPI001359885C|nr:orotidine-5'-phosphate decarboxylase [Andreprevotia sp. IGB-42]KAF0815016.1 Orotidine 5'-phosphate decarboxylase [Andreprevotia sp. IGB-42]